MKKILFLILALSFCGIASAQKENEGAKNNRRPNMEKAMEEIQSRKIAFFTKALDLSSEEAKVFWPVYDKCEGEMNTARRELRKSAKALQDACTEGRSDEEILSLADTYYENVERVSSMQKLHYYEYQKVLPVKKAAMVRMVEERFMNSLIREWKKPVQKPRPDKPQQQR
ncbi:MAG: hypothetical protein IK103_01995 [Bacteroidales bacterium]|nr:hypothetical protein [Bacteroidales bacterium]MBR6465169.1 hypothetical protein [Bacteroidales bacterium]